MGTILTLIGLIIAGGIIGLVARAVVPGEQNLSLPITVGLGAVGMFLGGIVGQILPFDNQGVPWIMGTVCAIGLLIGLIKTGYISKISK